MTYFTSGELVVKSEVIDFAGEIRLTSLTSLKQAFFSTPAPHGAAGGCSPLLYISIYLRFKEISEVSEVTVYDIDIANEFPS